MRTLFAWLFFASLATAQSVKLPNEVKGDPGSFITIPADTESTEVQWLVLDTGLNPFPVELLKSSKVFVATTLKPGRYRVFAYVGKGDKASPPLPNAICTVIVGDAPPIPPGPNPPDPKPPEPPTPKPDVELQKKFDEAYSKETTDKKKDFTLFMASLFKEAASKNGQVDKSITVKELFETLRVARRSFYDDGDFETIRLAYEVYLNGVLPRTASQSLTEDIRKKIKDEFTRVSTCLEAVAK